MVVKAMSQASRLVKVSVMALVRAMVAVREQVVAEAGARGVSRNRLGTVCSFQYCAATSDPQLACAAVVVPPLLFGSPRALAASLSSF